MATLLKSILLLAYSFILLTFAQAKGYLYLNISHQLLAILSFLFLIFSQAFILFYLIGVHRLVEALYQDLREEEAEKAQGPQEEKEKFKEYLDLAKMNWWQTKIFKSKAFPWTFLIIILGSAAFLLGGALDVRLVERYVHLGLVYGLLAALTVGNFNQWILLTKANKILRQLKFLFQIPDHQM